VCVEKNKNNVYIAGVRTLVPDLYDMEEVVDTVYSSDKCPPYVSSFARKAYRGFGIKQKATIRKVDVFPKTELAKEEYTPLNWGNEIVRGFSEKVNLTDVGCMNVSFNVTSHENILPNMACQVAAANNLALDSIPYEYAHLGCAGIVCASKRIRVLFKSRS